MSSSHGWLSSSLTRVRSRVGKPDVSGGGETDSVEISDPVVVPRSRDTVHNSRYRSHP